MKTRRGFLYTLAALPVAAKVASIFKPKQVEISSDDLLFHSRPIPDGMIFSFDEESGKWESRESKESK